METQDFDQPDADAPATEVGPAPVDATAADATAGEHTIEHRSFGRADVSVPMPVTVITTRESLAASNTGA